LSEDRRTQSISLFFWVNAGIRVARARLEWLEWLHLALAKATKEVRMVGKLGRCADGENGPVGLDSCKLNTRAFERCEIEKETIKSVT
jgi:hypothetical protein